MRARALESIRLTRKSVAALSAPSDGERIIWDADLKGFGIRISSTGRKTYFVYGRSTSGRQFKGKVGVEGQITADTARDIAGKMLGQLAAGTDLAEERRKARQGERLRLSAPTVRELAEEYLRDHAEVTKRPASILGDRQMLGLVERGNQRGDTITILGRLGSKKVAEVTLKDISDLRRDMGHAPYRANRMLSLLSHMFRFAVDRHMRADNPTKGVARYDEEPRERYLKPDEITRLAKALAKHKNRTAADAVEMMLLTGARRGEVLNATWDQFDLDAGIWTKPSSHTKQKRVHRVPLSAPALALLGKLHGLNSKRREGAKIAKRSNFVFPGKSADAPITDIKKFWASLCSEAKISGVRLHDLRHSYASLLVSAGLSLPTVGALLGHTQPRTTARYSHLADGSLRDATAIVGEVVSRLASAPDKVVSL